MDESLHVNEVVHAMASLVQSSFGPMGAETLLFCPPEPPVLTSSGYTILHYADMTKSHTAHPMKSFLMQKVRAVYGDMGDGVVQYLVLLDLIVQRIELSRDWSTAFATAKAAIGPEFQATFDALSIRTAVTFDRDTRQPSPSVHAAATAIVTTAMTGLFSPSVVSYLAALTVDWLFISIAASTSHHLPTSPADLFVFLDHIQRHANDALLQLSMGALDASRITRRHEYLLRLASHSNVTLRDEKLPSGQRMVLFVGSLEQLGADANSVELQVSSAHSYLTSIQWCAQRVVSSCRQLGMVCIPFVDKADVLALATRTGVSWVTSVFDPVDESRHVATNTAPLRCIRAGGASFLVLDGLASASSMHPYVSEHIEGAADSRSIVVPQVLLRGPSKGMCKQYYYAVKKGLRVLRFWCSSSAVLATTSAQSGRSLATGTPCMESLGGAQAPELAFAHALMGSTAATSGIPLKVRVLLAQALVGTHSQLRANLTASAAPSTSLPSHIHPLLMRRLDVDTCAGGPSAEELSKTWMETNLTGLVLDVKATLDTRAGPVGVCRVKAARPDECGVVHPFSHCCRLLEHVLGTLEEMCRLDKQYLRVRRLKRDDDDA